ncbi:MAG: hypothetical protein F4138_03120 [Acidimicrobiia bacterium]|nr:hypothetical protein [Acidimicrobiia bacterium]
MSDVSSVSSHIAEVIKNRQATLPLIVEEALRQRKDQDERYELLQRITGLFLGIFLPGSGLVVFSILGLDGRFDLVTAWVSAVLFVLGLASAILVFWPRRWEIGPSIRALVEGPFQRGDDEFEFRYNLLMAQDRAYKTNERRVRFAGYMMKATIVFFVFSFVSLGVGVLRYDAKMSGTDTPQTEIPASQAEEGQSANSGQDAPPLPTVEPVRPTYAERGQNYHFDFETRSASNSDTAR